MTRKKFAINQEVETVVERILPFGVFVRLQDNTKAYIRRRELDLDADAEPTQVVQEGDIIRAVILNLGEQDKLVELSRRATLTDPWPVFIQRHHAGDVIRGEVRALHPNGVFVRIQSGISGFVPLEELAPKVVEKPEDVLWVGDDIEAVITKVEPSKKRVNLSINARLQQYDYALDTSAQFNIPKTEQEARSARMRSSVTFQETKCADLKNSGPILIVEDNAEVREALATWLRQKGIDVDATDTPSPSIIKRLASFRVFFIDLNLLEDDGLRLIQRFRTDDCKAYICVMSTPENLSDRAEEIEAAQVSQVFEKPLDLGAIEQFLLQAAHGKPLPSWQAKPREKIVLNGKISRYGLESSSQEYLQTTLGEITSLIRAQIGLLFCLDPSLQTISILARTGQGAINQDAFYSLTGSPIEDVIKDGHPVFEDHITVNASARFAKLLNLLPFESCIGVPIPLQGEIRHAAFFFHTDVKAFSHYRLRDAQAGALLLSALLMDNLIQERLRILNPLLLSGELAASFGHDVSNKISALEMEASNLIDLGISEHSGRAQKMLELTQDLKDTVLAFRQILETTTQVEQISVERVIMKSIRLLRDMARKERVRVITKLEASLPIVTGNSTLLQQVFLNIMLNAIQQMVIKAKRFEWKGQRILEIVATTKEDLLQIRFKDNGPGIHKDYTNKIFLPGFSARGGSGLGLYIALGFIQALRGRILLEETFVPLGTTFLIELPCMSKGG